MTKEEREEIVDFLFFVSMEAGKYSKSFFERQSDEELKRMYDLWMEEGRLF